MISMILMMCRRPPCARCLNCDGGDRTAASAVRQLFHTTSERSGDALLKTYLEVGNWHGYYKTGDFFP